MKLQLVMLGLSILILVLGGMGSITFANNTSAALINGLVFGVILSSVINMIALKIGK